MRAARLVIWFLLILLASGLAFGLLHETRGVGFFDLEIIVDSEKPIRRVTYDCWNIDAETRQRVEQTADPHLFDLRDAERTSPNRFLASVQFTTRSGVLREDFYHPNQLVECIEF